MGRLGAGNGAGDMTKAVYDTDENDVVDNSEKLEGSTKAQVQDHTPKAHTLGSHTTHSSVKLDDLGTPDDNTNLDFGTARHGLVPKGLNVGDFLKDDGSWAAAAAGGIGLEEIGDVLLGSDAASIEFSSIPAGYAFFLLFFYNFYIDNIATQNIHLNFNGDTAANYDFTGADFGTGSGTSHARSQIRLGGAGDTDGAQEHRSCFLIIHNSSSHEKVVQGFSMLVSEAGGTAEDTVGRHLGGKWRDEANEINTITLAPSAGNIVAGTRVVLMGVKT